MTGKLAPIISEELSYIQFSSNKEDLTKEVLSESDLFVFGGSRALFTKAEFEVLKSWLSNGGRAIFLCGDGGEKQSSSNLNYFLEEYVTTLQYTQFLIYGMTYSSVRFQVWD